MRIGKLRHKIAIEQKQRTPDGAGGYTEAWVTFAEVYAAVEPTSGKEYFEAQQMQSEVTHKIRIRYLSGITPAMRVNFQGRIFEIISPPIDFEERHRDMMLMCREVIE